MKWFRLLKRFHKVAVRLATIPLQSRPRTRLWEIVVPVVVLPAILR